MGLSNLGGGRLEQLEELRRILAAQIDECESSRDLAALSRQYREVIREIDEIENGENEDDRAAELVKRHRQSQ